MPGDRTIRLAVIALATLVVLAVSFYPTDEKRVREAANALLSAANAGPADLSRALGTYASPEVRIDASELSEPLVGRDAIVQAVLQARALEPNLRLRAEGAEVLVEGKRARLNADLITTLRAEVPELRRPRHMSALFEQHGGHFQLISADIGRERRDQPEERP